MTTLEALLERVKSARGCDNSLDIAIDIALFKPDRQHISVSANHAGTKLVYSRYDGTTDTYRASDHTLNDATNSALSKPSPPSFKERSMSKLTKAQVRALDMMAAIGSMYPCRAAGHPNSFTALVRRGMATRIGQSGPFNITPAGRAALEAQTQ